jgi:hypothetical protein
LKKFVNCFDEKHWDFIQWMFGWFYSNIYVNEDMDVLHKTVYLFSYLLGIDRSKKCISCGEIAHRFNSCRFVNTKNSNFFAAVCCSLSL